MVTASNYQQGNIFVLAGSGGMTYTTPGSNCLEKFMSSHTGKEDTSIHC
jgi:hypothetical protein